MSREANYTETLPCPADYVFLLLCRVNHSAGQGLILPFSINNTASQMVGQTDLGFEIKSQETSATSEYMNCLKCILSRIILSTPEAVVTSFFLLAPDAKPLIRAPCGDFRCRCGWEVALESPLY